MRWSTCGIARVVAIALVCCCSHLRAALIDSFAVGPQSVTADPSNNNVSEIVAGLDTSQVLDGERQLTIQGAMSSGSINATVDTSGPGTVAYTSNSPVFTSAFAGRLLITHIPGNRFDTFDLSGFADQFYRVDVVSADFGSAGPNFDAEVQVSSPTGVDSTTITFNNSAAPYSVEIPMTALAGANLSQAFNLDLDISGIPADASFTIDNIQFSATAIPEPSIISLLAVIGVGATSCRLVRRRRTRPLGG